MGLLHSDCGEGVFGLQRTFKLAGVKTIITSLWKVPDTPTSELMQSFYKKWLGGMDKHEAFWNHRRKCVINQSTTRKIGQGL